jgi:hypothetical protein
MIDRQSWERIWNGTVIRTCPSNLQGLEEGNYKLLTLRDYFVILIVRPQTGEGGRKTYNQTSVVGHFCLGLLLVIKGKQFIAGSYSPK